MFRVNILESVLPLLSCPDDGGVLKHDGPRILCRHCGREFRRIGENVIDLLPARPIQTTGGSEDYASKYLREYERDIATCTITRPWGALEDPSQKLPRQKARQIEYVLEILKAPLLPRANTVCDLSAGAGHYTLEYARHFKSIIHCDLSADSILWSARAAQQLGLFNVAFVRADYLRLPFRGTLERVICLDTLIRGWDHERTSLSSITSALSPVGVAVVDFHNWWHNPMRRIGLMKNNFVHNRSYSYRETQTLLREAGITEARYFPFHQELPPDTTWGRCISAVLPSTRFVYRIQPSNQGRFHLG